MLEVVEGHHTVTNGDVPIGTRIAAGEDVHVFHQGLQLGGYVHDDVRESWTEVRSGFPAFSHEEVPRGGEGRERGVEWRGGGGEGRGGKGGERRKGERERGGKERSRWKHVLRIAARYS